MVWYALGALALSGMLVACMNGLYQVMENYHLFALEGIEIRDNDRIPAQEIVDRAAIPSGANILRLTCKEICDRVEAHPWVAHASVTKMLPHRLIITVKERTPSALLAASDLYYVDAEGVVFHKLVPGEPRDFPVLTGFREADVPVGTRKASRPVATAMGLLRIIEHYPDLNNISEINYDPQRGWTVYPLKSPVPVYLGVGDMEQKIVHLSRIFRDLLAQNPVPDLVDLSFPCQAIVKKVPDEKAVCTTLKPIPSRARLVGSGPTT